jgi:hypothetical protein
MDFTHNRQEFGSFSPEILDALRPYTDFKSILLQITKTPSMTPASMSKGELTPNFNLHTMERITTTA